ncbi:MAG: DUF3105 domain-containing protein [Dehalococcoidia bacterium]
MARQQRVRRQQAARRAMQRGDRRSRQQAKKRVRKGLYLGISGVIAALVIGSMVVPSLLGQPTRGTGATSYEDGVGEPQALTTARHLEGTIEYSTIPPSSGDHWSSPSRCGFYDEEVRDEIILHNLEHGNVIMSHNLTEPSDIARLRDIHDRLEGSADWLVTRPYSKIAEGDIAITAWGVLDQFSGIDEERIRRFFDAYKGNRFSEETRGIGRGVSCTAGVSTTG